MVHRWLSRAWLALGVCLVLLAVAITAVRYGGPLLNQHRQALLNRLFGSELGVQIDEVGLTWVDRAPALSLRGLSVNPSGSRYRLLLGEAQIRLDLWRSLQQQQAIFRRLDFSRLDLTLDLTQPAAASSDQQFDTLLDMLLGRFSNFTLHDSRLRLKTPLGDLTTLSIADLRWQNRGERHQGVGKAYLVEGVRNSTLDLVIDLQGPSRRWADLEGKFYLAARHLDLGPLLGRMQAGKSNIDGQLDLQLWSELKGGQWGESLLKFGNNYLIWQEKESMHRLGLDGGQIQLRRDGDEWQLASYDVQFKLDGRTWLQSQMQLERIGSRIQGAIPRIELDKLSLLGQLVSGLYPDLSRTLGAMQPHGVVSNLQLTADADWSNLQVSGELEKVGGNPYQLLPGVQALDGEFWITPEGGSAELRLGKDRIDTGGHFKQPIAVDRFSGRLDWWRQDDSWSLYGQDIALDNADLTLDTRFRLDLANQPFLALTGSVDLKNAGHADRYYPLQAMGMPLVDYLSGALKGGHAKHASLLWYGAFADFPYAKGEGIFQAAVPLEQTTFQFDPGWQPLTDMQLDLLFENASLDMQSRSAVLGKATSSRIHARIPYLGEGAHLFIDADVAGDGRDVSDYLINSPLHGSVGKALTEVQVTGPLTGLVGLDIPLDGESEVKVGGEARFEGSKVKLASLGLPLEQVHGVLSYDNEKTGFKGLKAQLFGNPVTLDYSGQTRPNGYQVNVGVNGEWSSARTTLSAPGLEVFSGKTRWGGKVAVSLPQNAPFSFDVDLSSDLRGMALNLPTPLAKGEGASLPLRVTARGRDGGADLHGVLGMDTDLVARLEYGEGPAHLSRLRVDVGQPGTRKVREAPMVLTISQNEADVGGWLSKLSDWLPARSGAAPALVGVPFLPAPWWVDGHINRAKMGSATLKAVQFTVGPTKEATEVLIESPEVLGVVRVPLKPRQPVEAQFGRLHWSGSSEDFKGQPDNAQELSLLRAMPWLRFTCADCRFGDIPLGQIKGELKPGANRVELDNFSALLGGSTLKGKALWRAEGNLMQTRLEGKIETNNSELLLHRFGYVSPISDAPGKAEFVLGWDDVPWRPSRAGLGGESNIKLDGGTLREVNDRGARILSLLSFDSLVRKLRLDFRDVFDKGLYFESMTGSFKISHGLIDNRDFFMKGAAGNLRGEGIADLVRWNVDYQLSFSPNLGGTLPVVAAFSLTPLTGLYVFALSKLLEPVVDVVTRIDFRVEGPLDNPHLSEAGRSKARIKLNAEQQKAAAQATPLAPANP